MCPRKISTGAHHSIPPRRRVHWSEQMMNGPEDQDIVAALRRRREILRRHEERALREDARAWLALPDGERVRRMLALNAFAQRLAAAAPGRLAAERVNREIEEEGNRRLRAWLRRFIRDS
jgi:hypothetical protein